MRADGIKSNQKLSFKMALKPISKKAYDIGGQALVDAEPVLKAKAIDKDIEIIPKKGFLTKIEGLIIFVTKKGEKKGQWFSLSKDPKGFLPVSKSYKTIESFTKENIISSAEKAEKSLVNNAHKPLSRASASFLPSDLAIITKLFKL